jgi:hypothetical protein
VLGWKLDVGCWCGVLKVFLIHVQFFFCMVSQSPVYPSNAMFRLLIMKVLCYLMQCSYPVVAAMLMRVLPIESSVEYAVSPESLTCAIEERNVQDDHQRVNNADVTDMHMQGMHALSRSPQPGLVTDGSLGSGWNCRHQLSAVAFRSPTPHRTLSCFATCYTTSQLKHSNLPRQLIPGLRNTLIPETLGNATTSIRSATIMASSDVSQPT